MSLVSSRISKAEAAFAAVRQFFFNSRYSDRRFEPGICDFTFGNPHELPLDGVVDALRESALPRDKNWFAYKTSEHAAQTFLAEHVGNELGLVFQPEDFALTAGAFGAIMVAFRLVLDAGDEAIICEPAWFCYEPMLLAADAVARKVKLSLPDFDLDVDEIERAIGPKTKLVIINTPHNPTGRIYSRTRLEQLSIVLERASARNGHRIFLLSDEPYRRLRFDGRDFISPANIYPHTLIAYSYGKVLLTPGQRLGYLAVSPRMPSADRHSVRDAMQSAQMALGWCFPNALMQYAVPDLETLSIDQAALARRRDRLTATLVKAGFRVVRPHGTFYLWIAWPDENPQERWDALADRDVFVMPGSLMDAPGYFRICLTASDSMVDRALPVFESMAFRARQ